jgi:hypothetical protein
VSRDVIADLARAIARMHGWDAPDELDLRRTRYGAASEVEVRRDEYLARLIPVIESVLSGAGARAEPTEVEHTRGEPRRYVRRRGYPCARCGAVTVSRDVPTICRGCPGGAPLSAHFVEPVTVWVPRVHRDAGEITRAALNRAARALAAAEGWDVGAANLVAEAENDQPRALRWVAHARAVLEAARGVGP